jgi:Tol biopolymer transport system component
MRPHPLFLALLVFLCFSALPAFAAFTELVSMSSSGEVAGHTSRGAAINADGRYVSFGSLAGNLVPHDSGPWDSFVRDRLAATTELVSVGFDGERIGGGGGPISADGRYVIFGSRNPDTETDAVFVRDRLSGTTQVGPTCGVNGVPDGRLWWLGISGDGRYIAFSVDLASGFPQYQAFLWDLAAQSTEPVVGSGASQLAISADGRYAAFLSEGAPLDPGIFVRDRIAGTTEMVSVNSDGEPGNWPSVRPAISADGRYVAFLSDSTNLVPNDTNDRRDVFVHDRWAGTTERVSVSSTGAEANDRSGPPAISADGAFVAFGSPASNLVSDDTNDCWDIFLRDRVAGLTRRVSVSHSEEQANDGSDYPAISADGHYVAFESIATNLTPEAGTSSHRQIFVRDVMGRFWDVPGFFWAYDAIEACAAAGIVSGYPDGRYQPGGAVTRDQMAVYISRALAGGKENVPDFTDIPTFPDVGDTHWALKHVEYAVSQNVVAGYQDGSYHPEYPVTRDQMAVYVARSICDPTGEDGLADYTPVDPRNFPDVASDFWSYKHVEYCVENGVVAGYLDGLYHPELVVTRDQMAVYVARAFDLTS